LCQNNGLPLDEESGSPEDGSGSSRKRDLLATAYQILEKRRKSAFSKKVKALVGRAKQTLRTYFSRGQYFNRGGQAPAQGLFRQAAPIQPAPNPGPGAIDSCMDGRLAFIPMHNQIDLTPQVISDYNPETEHPIDVCESKS
jgi:hypothetical protein